MSRSLVLGALAAAVFTPRLLFAAEPLPSPPPAPPSPPAAAAPSAPPPSPAPAAPPLAPSADPGAAPAPPPGASPAPEAVAPAVPPVAEAPAPPPEVAPAPAAPASPPGAALTETETKAPASGAPTPASPGRPSHRLFFQAAGGAGMFLGTNGVATDTRSFSGMTLSWNLMLGGTLNSKWALGAGFSREHVPNPSAEDEIVDGDEANLEAVTFSSDTLFAFVDVHPFEEGLHGLVGLGAGGFTADRGSGTQGARDAALNYLLGIGYDQRLAETITVGGLAQLTWARPEIVERGQVIRLNLFFPTLLVTVAYR